MKKILPYFFCLLMVSTASAQDSMALRKHYMKMYNQALAYNDIGAAINSLHGYIAADNNIQYKDTLSMLYFSAKSYVSALILAEEVYKTIPGNVEAMARAEATR